MSALLPVTVDGVPFQANGEFTSSVVATQYQNSLAALVNIFNLGLDPAINGVNPNSSTLSSDILNAINNGTYAAQLTAALTGGTVTKNYNVNTAIDGTRPPTDVQVNGLFNLLKDGMTISNDPNNPNFDPVLRPGQVFLSVEMAGAL